jgi:TrmH family RNA methyltransferase
MDIISIANPRVKQWVQLMDKKGRDKQGKFVVEGIHLVNEALLAQVKIECIIYSISQGIPKEIHRDKADSQTEWIGVSDAVLAKCSDTITPQGVFAVVHKWESDIQRIMSDQQALVIAIDGIQDPGNLGTIIRSADAVGATGVVIGKGSVDLYNPKTVRATMGSLFHLPIVESDLEVVLPQVSKMSVDIISTGLDAERHCYAEDFTKGIWIIVGNEGQGVSAAVSPFVNRQVLIPMAGQAESLNVAMAATIILYEALRQREYS